MKFGVTALVSDQSVDPVFMARTAEDYGFESFFLPEHTHIPTARTTPYPGGGEMPVSYRRMLDPFVTLAAIASVTSRIRLGTAVTQVVQRDPIVLAKEVSTLDLLSGGRFLFGAGIGWNREEMANHGVDPKTRMSRFTEHIRALKTIWTQDEPEFHGDFVDFDPIWQWPKPVQSPHPPILIGGDGPTALRRTAELADEWLPLLTSDPQALGAKMEELDKLAAEFGRTSIPVTILGVPADEDLVAQYAALGVARCVFAVSADTEDDVTSTLEWCAQIASAV